jgi:hypothetical protein
MSAATRRSFPADARPAVEIYQAKGLATIPLPPRSKDPGYTGWRELRLTPDNLDRHFPAGAACNVGVLNGAPSGNMADVDLDVPQAVHAAPLLLPPTGWIFGRQSAPRSHWEYRTDSPLDTAQEEFTDVDGAMLLELRGTGGLTVYPPSTHEERGERVTWDKFEEPAAVALGELRQAVRALAAAVLLARHWPSKGSRDRAAMALAGGLTRAGWDEERTSRFCEAVAVAAVDEEARMRAGKAKPTARKQEEGKHTTGWPRLMELVGEKVVATALVWLGVRASGAAAVPLHEPPLPEPPPWPEPPGEEAFHGLAGRFVRAIEPASEADPAALLVQTLVAFGNVIGRAAHYTVEADRHHGNEFVVVVGRTSGARKGTSWGRVHGLFQEAEELWAAERIATGLSSGQGLIWHVRDPISKRERVKEKGQVRYEEVEADPGVEDKRLLVVEPEFASCLKLTEQKDSTLSAVIRNAWDGRDLRILNKNSPVRATGAHVSIIGHITVEELRRYLTATEMANGFGNRFLWVCAKRSKLLPDGGTVDPAAWAGLRQELAEALAFARDGGEMTRDEEARALWREVYGQLSEGKPGLAGALLARAEAHVLRLSMLYALLDKSAVIRAEHLMAALTLWDYCERSVYHIFGDCLGDPVADDLLRLLRNCPQGLTRNDIMNYLGRNVPSERIGRALGSLLQHGLARREQEKTGGRPAERWFAVVKGQARGGA